MRFGEDFGAEWGDYGEGFVEAEAEWGSLRES